MKKIPCFVFLAFWTAAFCFPLVVRNILLPAKVVRCEPFNRRGENRAPATRPSLKRKSPRHVAWKDYGPRLEAWYNDAFPWRTELLRLHTQLSFSWFKSAVRSKVPGRGNWIFRRGGDWAELDDYLGALELTETELADWITLFEGRREWAKAMGAAYLTMPAPLKAQVRWQEMYPALRKHRGQNVGAQIRQALADSPARDDVLFAGGDFEAAYAAGHEVFFDADHHPSAYGIWLLYDCLNRRLAELFPGRVGATPPWYDDPPEEVRSGRAPGCWPSHAGDQADVRLGICLAVSSPGEAVTNLDEPPKPRRYPFCNVETTRSGTEGGLDVLMGHDSYMRFSLASWHGPRDSVRFPFAEGVGHVAAFIFKRFTIGFLESATQDAVPDVIIEQFAECRLNRTVRRYLDPLTRSAALFGRAADPAPGRLPQPGDRIAVRVVYENLRPDDGKTPSVAPLWNGGRIALSGGKSLRYKPVPGVRRAVFFDFTVPEGQTSDTSGLTVSLEDGSATSTNLVWRLLPEKGGPLNR